MKTFFPVLLASTSPQRRILLEQMGVPHEVHALDCHEDHGQSMDAEELVELICRDKLEAAFSQIPTDLRTSHGILCADTMVALDHHRLGKPVSRDEADRFLQVLSGNTHQVITGMIWQPPAATNETPRPPVYRVSVSDVRFRKLDRGERDWYLDCGEWMAAAGAYRIQGRGACLVEEIRGSWTGIMGLAVELLFPLLQVP